MRELENLLHRALALSDGELLDLDELQVLHGGNLAADLPRDDVPIADLLSETPHDLQAWLDQQERAILMRALAEAGFNRTAAG